MAHVSDFSFPVHRSLMQRNLILGIPPVALLIILLGTVFFVYRVGQYWFLAITFISWFVCRAISKHDAWLIDVLLLHLSEKDKYYP